MRDATPDGATGADWWPYFELGLLALLLPVVLFMRPAWSPGLLALPALWLLRWRREGRPVPATPLDPPLLLLLLAVLVTVIITPDLPFSLPKIAGLLYGVALYYAVVAAVAQRPSWLWYATGALAAGGSLLTLLGLAAGRNQLLLPLPAAAGLGALGALVNRLPGTPLTGVNPNEVAGIITWLAPWLAALLLTALRRRAWPVALPTGALFAFLTGALLLTGSRSAWSGVGMALLFLTGVHWRHRRRLVAVGGLLLLIVAAIVVIVEGPTAVADALVAGAGPGEGLARTLRGRQELWSRAWYVLQDFPLTGVGLNNFRRVVPLLYPLFLMPPAFDFGHAHNQLLHVGAELGIPGLVAYVAIWGGAAWLLVRAWRRAPSPWHRALAAGLGASLLAFFIFGLTDAQALGARPGFLWWLLLGVVAALERQTAFAAPG